MSITNSRSMLKLMSIESVMPSNHLVLCCPLLLLPSVFPSIRIFSWWKTDSAWGSQSIRASALASVLPMNIHGWFPLRLTGLISLLSKGLSRVPPTPQFNSLALSLLYGPTLTSVHDSGKITALPIQTLPAKWCLWFLIHCLGWS